MLIDSDKNHMLKVSQNLNYDIFITLYFFHFELWGLIHVKPKDNLWVLVFSFGDRNQGARLGSRFPDQDM